MTAKEKANEYLERVTPLSAPVNAAYNGYVAGYNEAMRWRDPKVELPETGKPVLVKYRTAKNVEKYGIGRYINLGIGNPWTIEGSTSRYILGWRPIE